MKERMIPYYMAIAEETAKLSHARELKVGAIAITTDDDILYSYNGTLPGDDNVCEDVIDTAVDIEVRGITSIETKNWFWNSKLGLWEKLRTKSTLLHAEENLLLKFAKSKTSSSGATIFVTHSPCIACARKLVMAGIVAVYFREEFKSREGLDLLAERGIYTRRV